MVRLATSICIGKMRRLRTAGFNSQYFDETICVYSLLERFDMFAKIDNYRSTIEKIYCRQFNCFQGITQVLTKNTQRFIRLIDSLTARKQNCAHRIQNNGANFMSSLCRVQNLDSENAQCLSLCLHDSESIPHYRDLSDLSHNFCLPSCT